MKSTVIHLIPIATLARALSISLPPLIPNIPGVTTPWLNDVAPPLPILQVPTPPLDSPPFTPNTSIKPKKIGYFWTGAGDKDHKGKLSPA
jgi:selenium-binding protein 1